MVEPLQEPALRTPPGVVSQFPTTHSDEQAWYYVAATLSAVVPGTLVLLRLYTKSCIVRHVDLVDYLTTLSFLLLIALLICSRFCLAEGAGVHQWNLPMHNYIGILYWFYVAQIVYAPTMFSAKSTILLQYLRIFAPQKSVDPLMWYSARIIITATGLFYFISTFLTIFACSPRVAIWNPLITSSRCLDNNTSVLITCIYNIVSDFIILLLPIRAVWKLRISTRNKLRILPLFAIGFLACIATVMIIVYLSRMSGENADVSYNICWLGLWVFAETSLGITVTGTFLVPKFVEAKGAKLRGVFTRLTRSFPSSLTSIASFAHVTQLRRNTITSQDGRLDTMAMIGRSESNASTINRDQDVERQTSDESVYHSAGYTGVSAPVIPHSS
ncbi:hypothetical protein BDR22DRAFT_875971 [Usnea florida]